MKSLFATAGAFALLFSAAACDQRDPVMADIPAAAAPDMAEPEVPARNIYVLAAGEIEASDLLGASVHDSADAEISIVEDIWLASGRSKALLVLRDGGVAGVGGNLRTLDFDSATIGPDAGKPGDEPKVIVQLSEGSLGQLPEFQQVSANDDRLASEIIGKKLTVSGSDESVRINDLILAANGDTAQAVITLDAISLEQIVIDAGRIMVAEGDADGELVLDVTPEMIADAPGYTRE